MSPGRYSQTSSSGSLWCTAGLCGRLAGMGVGPFVLRRVDASVAAR